MKDDIRSMYNGFGMLFGSDIDHFNSAPPELTVLSMEAPHTQRMRPIRSSHLAAITPSTEEDGLGMRNVVCPIKSGLLL